MLFCINNTAIILFHNLRYVKLYNDNVLLTCSAITHRTSLSRPVHWSWLQMLIKGFSYFWNCAFSKIGCKFFLICLKGVLYWKKKTISLLS